MSGPTDLAAALRSHHATTPEEARNVRRTIAYLTWLHSPFDEHADPTHVTGSAIVLDADGRVLLHRHKRLGIWLQPGGHLDAGEDPAAAAVRETREETGLPAAHPDPDPRPLHVDVHEGPRGHVHLDVRYLLLADAGDALAPGAGESPDVAWFTVSDALRVGDRSLAAAITAAHRNG